MFRKRVEDEGVREELRIVCFDKEGVRESKSLQVIGIIVLSNELVLRFDCELVFENQRIFDFNLGSL